MALVDPIAIERQTMQDIVDAVRIRTARGSGGRGGALSILVTAPTGSTVTAEKDGKTYTGVEDAENPGSYSVSVPEYGTYNVGTVAANGNRTSDVIKLEVAPASVEITGVVPEEYQVLEYLEATGSQYIRTNTSLSESNELLSPFEIYMKFMQASTAGTADMSVIGSENISGGQRLKICNIYQRTIEKTFYNNAPSFSAAQWPGAGNITENSISCDQNGRVTQTVSSPDGTVFGAGTGTWSGGTNSCTLSVFGISSDATSTKWLFSGRIYRIDIISNGKSIMRLRAVRRVADGELGMYDTANDIFYTNAGTGEFIAGPEVA